MSDYVEQLDRILSGTRKEELDNAGEISYKQAMGKAEEEYKKYVQKNLSPIEKEYLNTIKAIEEKAKKQS